MNAQPGAARARLRFAAVYALAWTPLVVLYTVGIAATGAPLADAVSGGVNTALTAMLLGVVPLAAARRFSRRGTPARRFLPAHLALALLYGLAWTGATLVSLRYGAPREVFARYLAFSARWEVVSGTLIYAAIAGVGHALEAARLLREREAAAARAELHALRAQLDPHFLFNTLHSLTALARRDPGAVERGLERFGGLLRYVLDANRREAPGGTGAGDVPLDEELAFVRDYLGLERMRLGDRLRVEVAADDEARECALPALTLQPLVENAVRHGIAVRPGGGTVRVRAEVDGRDRLVVEVADDGVGCDAASADRGGGIGIAVVRRRLRARYGDAGRLDVVTAPGQGFVARVAVPAAAAPAARAPADRAAGPRLPPTAPARDTGAAAARVPA